MKNSILSDKNRFLHILDAISEIESYLHNLSPIQFFDSSLIRNATLMQIQIIGEATSHISDSLKAKYPHIEWKQIIGTRNIIAHEYFGIDFDIVWNIAYYKLPIYKDQVKSILKTLF